MNFLFQKIFGIENKHIWKSQTNSWYTFLSLVGNDRFPRSFHLSEKFWPKSISILIRDPNQLSEKSAYPYRADQSGAHLAFTINQTFQEIGVTNFPNFCDWAPIKKKFDSFQRHRINGFMSAGSREGLDKGYSQALRKIRNHWAENGTKNDVKRVCTDHLT